jgi:hypothetical protein
MSTSRACENGPDSGRPPLAATLRRGDAVGIKRAGDLAEAPALSAFRPDARDDVGGHVRRPAGAAPESPLCSSRSSPLGDVAPEFRDRDQAHAPLVEEGVEHGYYATIDRRDAYAESLSGLLSRVGESLHPIGRPRTQDGGRRRPGRSSLPRRLAAPPRLRLPLPPARHEPYIIQQP